MKKYPKSNAVSFQEMKGDQNNIMGITGVIVIMAVMETNLLIKHFQLRREALSLVNFWVDCPKIIKYL